MKWLKTAIASACLVSTIISPNLLAHEQGDFIFRFGFTRVDPNDDSSKIWVDGLGTTGMEASVNDDTQIGLNFLYMMTDEWGIELLGATPFEHDLFLEESELGLGDGKLADAKQLPPTLSAIYFFNTQSAFQPYVGLGVNYTEFFEDSFTEERKAQGFNGLELDESWGWSAQVGADYMLSERWMLNASIRYIDIDTDADFNVGDAPGRVSVEIDPTVITFAVGYKF